MTPEAWGIIVAAGFGVAGALVRVLIVSLKTVQSKPKRAKISGEGMWIYAAVVLSVGAFSGIVLNFGKVLSFLAGYAGLDLIEGYYKTFRKKKIKIG